MAQAIAGNLDNGVVRCGCGKKVGEVTGEGVEFWCSSCKAPVEVKFNEMKLGGMLTVIAGINTCVASLTKLADLVATMQPTTSPA